MEQSEQKKFDNVINQFNLSQKSKKDISQILNYKNKKYPRELLSRIFIFLGEHGLGKTYLAEKIVSYINMPTIYLANQSFSFRNSKRCSSLNDLIKNIDDKEQVIFIDDINYFLKKEDCEVTAEDKRMILNLLHIIKSNHNKLLLITTDCIFELDDAIISRLDIKIMLGVPIAESKKIYLEKNFSKYLSKSNIGYLAENSVGFNYRELPELIKFIYRISDGKINTTKIKTALEEYKPASLNHYDIINVKNIGLNHIIGKEQIVNTLKKILKIHKNPELSKKLCIKRNNLLLFHGPPGTGKTYATKAFAAELGYQIIQIKGKNIFARDVLENIENIMGIAGRYSKCVILIDEADKIIGNSRFGEDGVVIGEFNRAIESIEKEDIQAIVVLTMNDISRFGDSFQDRFVTIEFPNPSYSERMQYCQKKIETMNNQLLPSDIVERLARTTNDMSYREIDRLWNKLMYATIDEKPLDDTAINKILMDVKKDEATSFFG